MSGSVGAADRMWGTLRGNLHHAAGVSLWPLDSWAQRRGQITGQRAGSHVVACEVEQVLAAMRSRPEWYAEHVRRPLGAKVTVADIHLTALASIALDAIEARPAAGSPMDTTVAGVITTVFGLVEAAEAGGSADARASNILAEDKAVD